MIYIKIVITKEIVIYKKKKTYSTDNNLIDFKKKAFNFFKTSNAK